MYINEEKTKEYLINLFNKKFSNANCKIEEFEKIIPHLSKLLPRFGKFLSSGEYDFNKEYENTTIYIISNWLDSRNKTLEDYGLSQEAIRCLKKADYNPARIHEDPDNFLKEIYDICFDKKSLVDEIIEKFNIENPFLPQKITRNDFYITSYIKSSHNRSLKRDPNGSKIILTDNGEPFLSVPGKLNIDDEESISAPTLFIVDAKGNVYTQEEFEAKYNGIEKQFFKSYEDFVDHYESEKKNAANDIFKYNERLEKNLFTYVIATYITIIISLQLLIEGTLNSRVTELVTAYAALYGFFKFCSLCTGDGLVLPNLLKLIAAKKSRDKIDNNIEKMQFTENIDTTFIAESIEEMFRNGIFAVDKITDVAKILSSEEIAELLSNSKKNQKKQGEAL